MDRISKDEVIEVVRIALIDSDSTDVDEDKCIRETIAAWADKAAQLDAMMEDGAEFYEYKSNGSGWQRCSKLKYELMTNVDNYETRRLYALPSQEKCDGA